MKTETKDKIIDFIVDIVIIGCIVAFIGAVLQALYILVSPAVRCLL